jgi:hypothetical protein
LRIAEIRLAGAGRIQGQGVLGYLGLERALLHGQSQLGQLRLHCRELRLDVAIH